MAFAEPFALAFAGLYGVLILFYLWDRWRRRVVVPSLLLWAAVREDTIRARRWRPDLLFLLQSLLLAALIGGLAGPYFPGAAAGRESRRHVLVLDTSASMQAREARTTRFEAARQEALRVLRDTPANDEVMLIGAGRTPTVLSNFTRDHDAVAAVLAHTVPTDTGGDLAVALAFAESARQRSDLPTELVVFTDIPRRQLPPALRDRATFFQFGETDDNLGIEGLQIYQGRFQDYRAAQASILVQNFAHREGHGLLVVQLGDQVVDRSGFTIPARASKGFVIRDFPGPGRVMAHLEAADALAADNTAYGWIRRVVPTRVLLVSPPSPLIAELQELAGATPGIELTVMDPEQFRAAPAPTADVEIFHRCVPDRAPAINALYIYPPLHNPLFPVLTDAANVEVVDWNARHPALQSIQPLAALPLQRARVMDPPDGTEGLLWTRTLEREFPLAWAGERDGRRFACITFDLEAERLLSSDNVNLFLFFMNLLSWLSPESGDAVVTTTGEARAIGPFPQAPVRVQDPRGAVTTLSSRQPVLEPLLVGAYRLSSDGTARTVLANFFDPSESDIGRAGPEPPAPPPAPAGRGPGPAYARGAAAVPSHTYSHWLYACAVALFLLEWLGARRHGRGGDA